MDVSVSGYERSRRELCSFTSQPLKSGGFQNAQLKDEASHGSGDLRWRVKSKVRGSGHSADDQTKVNDNLGPLSWIRPESDDCFLFDP